MQYRVYNQQDKIMNTMNPEMLIKSYVARHGESDGICLIHWLPRFFNGVVKNMGKATDILGCILFR